MDKKYVYTVAVAIYAVPVAVAAVAVAIFSIIFGFPLRLIGIQ